MNCKTVLLALAASSALLTPALAADGSGLGDRNVNIDPHTRFPSGAAAGDNSLADHVGGRLSPSTMIDHPATQSITTGWGGTTVPPNAGPVGGTGRPAPNTSPASR